MLKREIYTWFLLAIILSVGLFFRLIFLDKMNLIHDEALWWDSSRHPSFGYFAHPPMAVWMVLIGRVFFGDTEFGVRIPFVVLGLGTILAGYILGRTFFDKKVGLLLALFVSFSPAYILASRIATTDQPVIFFWIMSLIFFWRAYKDLRFRDWILLGIFLGLGFLSKYQMFFLPLAIFAFLVFSQKGRRILKTFQPYIGFGIAMLVFLPNILWNVRHGWITFLFQFVYGIERSFGQSFSANNILDNISVFLAEARYTPEIALKFAFFSSLPLFFWYGIRKMKDEFIFLFFTFGFIALFFSIFSGNQQWAFPGAIGVYLIFIAFVASFFRSRLLGVLVSIFILVLLCQNALNSWNRVYNLAFRTIPLQDFSKDRIYQVVYLTSYGQREMANQIVSKIHYKEGGVTIIAQDYRIASELAFYLPDRPRVYSPNNQYLIWGPPNGPSTDTIFVAYSPTFFGLQTDKIIKVKQDLDTFYTTVYIAKGDWRQVNIDWRLNQKGP